MALMYAEGIKLRKDKRSPMSRKEGILSKLDAAMMDSASPASLPKPPIRKKSASGDSLKLPNDFNLQFEMPLDL